MVWRGRRALEDPGLGLVDPFEQVKDIVASAGLGASARMQTGRLSGVRVTEDVVVEAVDGLALVLGGPELSRVEAQGVVRTTRVSLIRPVQQSAGAPPAPVDELLVEGGRQGCCNGIIGKTCRGQLLDNGAGGVDGQAVRQVVPAGPKRSRVGGSMAGQAGDRGGDANVVWLGRKIVVGGLQRTDGAGGWWLDGHGTTRKIHVLWTDHCESGGSTRTRKSCCILWVGSRRSA